MSIDSSQFTCPPPPSDWPWNDLPAMVYFPDEAAEYSPDNLWLQDVPASYVTPAGPCV